MSARVVYSPRADEDLRCLDRKIAQRIVRKVAYFANQKDPLRFAKRLKPPLEERWRFRVGDYRVIFRVGKDGALQLLMILRIKHRKDIYD